MRRGSPKPFVLLLTVVLVTAGCLDANDGDGDGDNKKDLPPLGTTEGFTFPDIGYSDHLGDARQISELESDFIIVHVIGSTTEVFEPQIAQIRATIEQYQDLEVSALTVCYGNDTTEALQVLASDLNIFWSFGLALSDLKETLSLVKPMTVFLLDEDRVILLRSDDILGQGRMVQAIDSTFGIEPPEDVHPEVGSTVPDLVWRDIDGVEGRLSDLEGSPVILNVWEMECPFCMELFTELGKVWANHSADGLQMVSVDLITWETPEEVRGVMEEYNANWTFAIDGDNIQSRYDIWHLPLLVLLDDMGIVQWVWTGYVHSSVISEEVEKLI